MNYISRAPDHEPLRSCVAAYGELEGEGGVSKSLSPRPGSTLSVSLAGSYAVDGVRGPDAAVFGIRRHSVCLEMGPSWTHRIQVQFTASGLARFIRTSASSYAGKLVPATELFPASSLRRLWSDLSGTESFEDHAEILDSFLLESYVPPTEIEQAIHELAGRISANPDAPLGDLLRHLPLSLRQTERYFARLVGVSPRSLARIARFQEAKEALLAGKETTLTDVGLAVGYYDQPHFGREFRRLASMTPGSYSFCPAAGRAS